MSSRGGRELDATQVARLLSDPSQSVHLIGIGGIGMAGVAYHLHKRGFRVTGSDAEAGRTTTWLRSHGIDVAVGHAATNLPADAAWVIRTPAVSEKNVELVSAKERELPVTKTRNGVAASA